MNAANIGRRRAAADRAVAPGELASPAIDAGARLLITTEAGAPITVNGAVTEAAPVPIAPSSSGMASPAVADFSLSGGPITMRYLEVQSLEAAAGTIRYLQLHDLAGAIPAGAVPRFSYHLHGGGGARSWVVLDGPLMGAGGGLRFATGLRLGWSTTATTYTADALPLWLFDWTLYP